MGLIKKLTNLSFIRFAIVGVINTLVGSAIMFGMYNLMHCGYWVSSAANYIVGSIVSFFLNKHFTFKNKDRSIKVVIRFIVNICVCYFVAYGIAKPLIRTLLDGSSQVIQDNVSMFAGMILFLLLNYFGQKFFAFKKTDKSE